MGSTIAIYANSTPLIRQWRHGLTPPASLARAAQRYGLHSWRGWPVAPIPATAAFIFTTGWGTSPYPLTATRRITNGCLWATARAGLSGLSDARAAVVRAGFLPRARTQ